MKQYTTIALLCGLLAAGFVHAASTDLVVIGDAGNAGKKMPFKDVPNPFPRGAVAYPYRIAKTEVANQQYAEFLTACAGQSDPLGLYHEGMKIRRTGRDGQWQYAPEPGHESEAVCFVSRINAARYCNYLTSGRPDAGAYTIKPMMRENGKVRDVLVGYRDLTFPDQAVVYFLPDMHEFYKAGWYDGKGTYRDVTPENRNAPSPYGLLNVASGAREWMDNKYWGASPFALGADDQARSADELNAVQIDQRGDGDFTAYAQIGFRVAATAPLQIGNRLNRANNFFFSASDAAKLRVRHDGAAEKKSFRLELKNDAAEPVWLRDIETTLKPGVNEIAIRLPEIDGYYELLVTPKDPLYGKQSVTIPLAVMREPMPAYGRTGHFGFTIHIARQERIWSFEPVDFELLRRLGVSQIRSDVSFDDTNGGQTGMRRIAEAGLNPLGGHPGGSLLAAPGLAEKNRQEHPEAVEKWGAQGIPAHYAWYAEQVYQLVSKHKDVVHDWEMGNEPWAWNCMPEDYAQILKAGYKAAKLADPTCNVMSGDISGIYRDVWLARGGDFCDSIAMHNYGFYVASFWGIAGKMREWNGWKSAIGIPQKPIWITECGGCTYSAMHMIPVRTQDEVRRYQAIHQPKLMAGYLAFGADKVMPYEFRDTPVDYMEEEFGMIDRYGLPKPAVASFRTAARLLGNAQFAGFVKGHTFAVGKIAGLAFKDAEQRDVAVFWRNDPYGDNKFDTPFFNMIKPAQKIVLKSMGDSAEIIGMSGGVSKVRDELLEIPVSEYPVYVRGKLALEFDDVPRTRAIEPVRFPESIVKIMPNDKAKAGERLSGVVLKFASGQSSESVTIRLYNLTNREQHGSLRLVPMNSWREWQWKVEPAEQSVQLPPDGMVEATFRVPVPKEFKPDQLFYLNAFFERSDGRQTRDTVAFRVLEKELVLKDWITYAKGFQLSAADRNRQVEITWGNERAGFVSFYLRTPVALAEDAAGLNADIVLPFQAPAQAVTSVSLLVVDKNNETYQLKQNVTLSGDGWTSVRFPADGILQKGVIVHKGGDGKVDFPVRLLGFNFDLKKDADPGTIRVKPYEISARAEP